MHSRYAIVANKRSDMRRIVLRKQRTLNRSNIPNSRHSTSSRTTFAGFAAALTISTFATASTAQNLLPPSRTVFKCEVAGKITYSDAPCLGAKKLEVEPTRGVSKLSGTERIGRDVHQERYREIMADALKPLTGMDAKQLDTQRRRMKLSPDDQRECQSLDARVEAAERNEQVASSEALKGVQLDLYRLRMRYRELGC